MKYKYVIVICLWIFSLSVLSFKEAKSQALIIKTSGYSTFLSNQISSGLEVKLPKNFSVQLVYTYFSRCNYDCTERKRIIPELRYYFNINKLDNFYIHSFYDYIYETVDPEEGAYREEESYAVGLGLGYQFVFKKGFYLDVGLAPTITNYKHYYSRNGQKISGRFSLFIGFNPFRKK